MSELTREDVDACCDQLDAWLSECRPVTFERLNGKFVRLIAAARKGLEPAWQPIATAPKDGTDVLLAWRWGAGGMIVGGFWPGNTRWTVEGPTGAAITATLTHWLPLPAPPCDAIAEGACSCIPEDRADERGGWTDPNCSIHGHSASDTEKMGECVKRYGVPGSIMCDTHNKDWGTCAPAFPSPSKDRKEVVPHSSVLRADIEQPSRDNPAAATTSKGEMARSGCTGDSMQEARAMAAESREGRTGSNPVLSVPSPSKEAYWQECEVCAGRVHDGEGHVEHCPQEESNERPVLHSTGADRGPACDGMRSNQPVANEPRVETVAPAKEPLDVAERLRTCDTYSAYDTKDHVCFVSRLLLSEAADALARLQRINSGLVEIDADISAENARLQAENERLEAQRKKFDIALQSLTPGGSEYVNDPERCMAVARSIRESQHKWIVEQTKKCKDAQATIERLEKRIADLEAR